MRVYILEGGNLGGHLGILPTIVCEIPISQMLKLRFRCMMQLAQGHRRTELGFRSGPIDSEAHASNPSLHHHHAFILWPSPDVLTLLFADCGETQVAACPRLCFVLQLRKLPPASAEQKGTEQAPMALNGAVFVQ